MTAETASSPQDVAPDFGQVRQFLGNAKRTFFSPLFASRLYHVTLRGPMPDRLYHTPPQLRAGRVQTGDDILRGRFALPGGNLTVRDDAPWSAKSPSEEFSESLHGFAWLDHLMAQGSPVALEHARALVSAWIDGPGRGDLIAWRPEVTARRLLSWLAHGQILVAPSDMVQRSRLLVSLGQQARHLARCFGLAPPGAARLTGAIALCVAGLCLRDSQRRLPRGLHLLENELKQQILPDGGYFTRNPQQHMDMLADLASLRSALTKAQIEVPAELTSAVDRMMPMLRFFRHGDGKLALFNGAGEGAEGAPALVLEYDDAQGKPFQHAPYAGFHRLQAGRSVIIFDAGRPPKLAGMRYGGCLSFELSSGLHRLVVNCGASPLLAPEWRKAGCATAAHSTLIMEDTSSLAPTRIKSRRAEQNGDILVEATHDGYRRPFGFLHKRRLFLAANGEDVRGEDLLEPMDAGRAREPERRYAFVIRFHLHPDVRVSLARDGSNALIVLGNGDGWQFRARGGNLALADSIYLGIEGMVRRAQQIIVSGETGRIGGHFKWAWRRISPRGSGTSSRAPQTVPET
jgi:uncharacterized heparinase superfamily protein